ncbi:MAG: ABC transporter substrate-binding protein [Chloroflexota bacterium]
MVAKKRVMERRTFLKYLASGGVGLTLVACSPAAAPAPTTVPAQPTAAAPKTSEPTKPAAQPTAAPTVQAKVLAGQTVKVLLFDHVYTRGINELLPEFEDLTGAKVELDLQAFAIANQRIDLELSSATGALDVMNMTFIWTGKWIGANWATELNPLIDDPQMTDKAALDVSDFQAGAIGTFKRGEKIYSLPWISDIGLLMYRKDIFEKNGITKVPQTIDEVLEVSKKIHTKEVAANLMRGVQSLHLIWPQFLQSYGGKVFANPEDNMTPMLNTPEAVIAADKYAMFFNEYGVPGSVTMADADCQAVFGQGKAAMWIDAMGVSTAVLDPAKSTVSDKVAFDLVPAGPAGRRPQVASHGFFIPAATKDKKKGWEFIKWAISKETMTKITMDKNYASGSRNSVLGTPEYKKKFNWGGSDIGALQMQSADIAGKEGYMRYRTVAEFGPIGDQMIISIGEIITKQKSTQQALDELQKNVIGILEQNGRKINA